MQSQGFFRDNQNRLWEAICKPLRHSATMIIRKGVVKMRPIGSNEQKIREEVVKALGQACKSPSDAVAHQALVELLKIKAIVFEA